MKIKNREELYSFLSTLDERNMAEYLCKEFFSLKKLYNSWLSMPVRAKILNNIVYWSGSKDDRKMLSAWQYNMGTYLFGQHTKQIRIEARKILNEIEVFVKKENI